MRTSFFSLVLPLGAFVAFGCGGTAETKQPPSSNSAVTPGSSCPSMGETAPAKDGCNTCSCTESGWACTEKACATGCSDGETKTADDGCNSCTCSAGTWACTDKACGLDSCPAPRELGDDVACIQVIAFARSPETGLCCQYGTPCAAPEGWETFGSSAECEGTPPCNEGESVQAPDGCNTCICGSDGSLACTKKACPVEEPVGCGGWLGDTCAEDEYCAYTEGQYCGAADASATCQKRPEACDLQYEPVCGCDGQPYGNACAAAIAGTGVNFAGPCDGGGAG